MNKIQLLKEPGYIYDLNFIFCLKFNMQAYIDNLPNDNEKEKNIAYFKDILNQFNDIPDDLFVFFHSNETGRAFLPTYYFDEYKHLFATTYNFQFLQNELSDQDRLIRNLIKFYFSELDEEMIEQCANSSNKIFAQIKESNYSCEEKLKLYEFFMNPSRYIQLLQFQLMQKEVKLSEYYKNNYQEIINLYNQTTMELICNRIHGLKELTFLENEKNVYSSYCLLNKYCINYYPIEEGFLTLFGYQYVNMLPFDKNRDSKPNMFSFCKALCEESRIKILYFLCEHKEASCKDLEKEFSFSGSTAYHHLSIMTKFGLINVRNEGKTILYRLNNNYIKDIISTLNQLILQ